MSRYADIISVLPVMLSKHPVEFHAAIVEVFAASIEGDWGDEEIKEFLMSGKGHSELGDQQITREASGWGITL